MIAFVGLGSNVGDRLSNLKDAIKCLEQKGVEVLACSSVYETDPVGPPQPDFLNAAVKVKTEFPPLELLAILKQIEREGGRVTEERWGPRLIDLDLLLFDDTTFKTDDLEIPHPEVTRRAFVMIPLLEVDPDLELPSGEPLAAFCEPNPDGIKKVGALV